MCVNNRQLRIVTEGVLIAPIDRKNIFDYYMSYEERTNEENKPAH
jgi:hypothetical protein